MYLRRLKINQITLIILLLAIEAHAKPHVPSCMQDAQCVDLLARARALSRAQDTEGSLRIYEAAYARIPDPGLLVNIGRMHQKSGRLELAAERFRRYMGSSIAADHDEIRLKVQAWLAMINSQIHSAAVPSRATMTADKMDSNVSESNESNLLLPLASIKNRPNKRPGLTLRSWWFWTSLGCVAAAAATGLAVGFIIGRDTKASQPHDSHYLDFQ